MIDIDVYTTQIDIKDLNYLVMGKEDLTSGEETTRNTKLEKKEGFAQSIIKNRFGSLPTDIDFLNQTTVAGVLFLLTRQDMYAEDDVIERRRATFFDMVPATPGSVSRAAKQSFVSKTPIWP